MPPGARDAMKFFHRGDNVGHVLDHVLGANLVEGIVAKRRARLVQMAKHVGGGVGFMSSADRAGIFRRPAPTSKIRAIKSVASDETSPCTRFGFPSQKIGRSHQATSTKGRVYALGSRWNITAECARAQSEIYRQSRERPR